MKKKYYKNTNLIVYIIYIEIFSEIMACYIVKHFATGDTLLCGWIFETAEDPAMYVMPNK